MHILTICLQEHRDTACSDAKLESWIGAYRLRDKLRYAPDSVANIASAEVCPYSR